VLPAVLVLAAMVSALAGARSTGTADPILDAGRTGVAAPGPRPIHDADARWTLLDQGREATQ
jgi:hypothetical protein